MKKLKLLSVLLFLGLSGSAFAQDAGSSSIEKADYGFIFIAAVLVFLMQAGFCLLEMGFSRSKNAINIVMKNMCDLGAGALGYFLVGFSLMFGWTQGGFVGLGNFGFNSEFGGEHPIWIFFLFQVMFAAAAATISSGAMAERTYFPGYLVYAAIACTFIYPLLGHWAWGSGGGDFGFGGTEGWLETLKFKDFAGSTVVHGIGGAFALAGIIVIGPRKGRFLEDGSARIFPGHNMPLAALGFFLLFFGWFGFNGGTNLTADAAVGAICTNTLLAGAAGLVGAMIIHWIVKGWADAEIAMNGGLGGLVSITACCNCVAPWAAIIIGIAAGLIIVFGEGILRSFRIDDAVGAVPVHLFCGFWGTLCVSIFNTSTPFETLHIQALGGLVIPISAFALSFVVFKIINATVGLRAPEEAQDQGLDFAEHSATAYPDFTINSDED